MPGKKPKKVKLPDFTKLCPRAAEPEIDKAGVPTMRSGEPAWIPLDLWQGDSYPRGWQKITCCDCGLKHLFSFKLVPADDGTWGLIFRGYRIEDGKPKPAPAKKRRTRK